MSEKEYPSPIEVTESGGVIHVSYDEVSVDFSPDGPIPEGVPPLARRIFEVYKRDIRIESRAE